MNAENGGEGERSLAPVVVALAVACAVLLVVVIVLAVINFSSTDSADSTPTAAVLATLTATQLPADTAVPAETPTATLVPSAVPPSTETPAPVATNTPTTMPVSTSPPTHTPKPTITSTPEPTPDCTFDAGGEFETVWQTYKIQLGCPLYPTPKTIQDAEQAFDNGHMFWRDDNQHIYVVYEKGALSGTYQVFLDEWEEGDPEHSCAGTPPAERIQPKRGFGLVWCKLGGEGADIGWGLEEEAGYWAGKGDPLVQDFGSGVIFRDSAGTVSGMAYLLFGATSTFVQVAY